MARPRKSKSEVTVTPTNDNEVKKERKIMALSPDQIAAIYAKRRTKGQYVELLTEFLASGEAGVSVKEQWGAFLGGKQPTTIKQGFEGAKDKKDSPEDAGLVDVIVDGDDVYLIHKVLAGTSEPVAA